MFNARRLPTLTHRCLVKATVVSQAARCLDSNHRAKPNAQGASQVIPEAEKSKRALVSLVPTGFTRPRLLSSVQDTAFDLILLNGFKQSFEVAFTKSVITFALNELEENRPNHGL